MRIFKTREDSLEFGLSFFLTLGAVLGTVFCNGMSGEMKQELLVTEQSMVMTSAFSETEFMELFLRILPKRLWTLMIIFLILSTTAAPFLLLLTVAYLGFSAAVMICPLTMEAGVLGIWKYLLLVFPQCLIYVPVGYLVLWWMPVKKKRLTVLSVIVLTMAVCLGAAIESLMNPWFLALLW